MDFKTSGTHWDVTLETMRQKAITWMKDQKYENKDRYHTDLGLLIDFITDTFKEIEYVKCDAQTKD